MTSSHTLRRSQTSSSKTQQLSLLLKLADNHTNRVNIDDYIDIIPDYGDCDFYLSTKPLAKLDTELLIDLYDALGGLANELESLDIQAIDNGDYSVRDGSDYYGEPTIEDCTIYTDKALWVQDAYETVGKEIDLRADSYSSKQPFTPSLVIG
jgi:hypothetical protein